MAAETFVAENNLVLAAQQLSYLGEEEPLRYVQQAIITAEELGYDHLDVELLADLARAFQTTGTP
ncbi:MAG: hypothetical protein CVU39_28330 [Chloroflexi bacterium HGW-Chloroflexi-10]|nr:MAG: hypothetical protein CVU39_28330 [Chloroflexi bacterium HGW-Chloroflexi-10]